MEQWHQKLHNNTTPDDVVICEAYLAFLYEGGNQDAYWRVLKQGGVTRERLASFERAITVDPEYFPDKQQALIRDCTHYLGILKACHSGAELQSSAAAAGMRRGGVMMRMVGGGMMGGVRRGGMKMGGVGVVTFPFYFLYPACSLLHIHLLRIHLLHIHLLHVQ